MKQAERTALDVVLCARELALAVEQHRACVDFPKERLLTGLYMIAGTVVDILGPMFWAALFVLFVEAEFPIS